ncbi:TetR/AcrR family transcriptional regulator [Litchfieldia alkalitelluris]|uniref:TetR/AcrR family transcriptional regulator n=1 Tax=Litchfieldia alkalitelluris TaxID=304268 RepID=UPI000996AB3E|nr:TetR/AcrR family transcriptional regulator [Litchfieldia alkalitelluris]
MSPRVGLDQQTILHAATEIVNEQGIEAITLALLAKKLNIRPPSLYNHIDGLEGLKKNLAIYGLDQLYEVLTKSAVGRSGNDAIHALSQAYIGYVRNNPGVYEASLLIPQDPDIQNAGKKIVDLSLAVLAHFQLKEEDALHAVRGLRSILHGFASLEQKGSFGLPISIDISLNRLVDSYLVGINTFSEDPK